MKPDTPTNIFVYNTIFFFCVYPTVRKTIWYDVTMNVPIKPLADSDDNIEQCIRMPDCNNWLGGVNIAIYLENDLFLMI